MADNRVRGLITTQGGVNPKDRVGATKIDLSCLPPTALAETAFAMMDGFKYGEYNWRVEPVLARTYVSAAMRHLMDWLDGEERAGDSLAHHLAHAACCCMILMDAQYADKLVDDRPVLGNTQAHEVFNFLNDSLAKRNAQWKLRGIGPYADQEEETDAQNNT